jgi:hypothetical protein
MLKRGQQSFLVSLVYHACRQRHEGDSKVHGLNPHSPDEAAILSALVALLS